MEEFLTYSTVDGERWDLLAQRYYGDGTAYGFLLQANPSVPFTPRLPAGLTLRVPILDAGTLNPAATAPTDNQEFPWL